MRCPVCLRDVDLNEPYVALVRQVEREASGSGDLLVTESKLLRALHLACDEREPVAALLSNGHPNE